MNQMEYYYDKLWKEYTIEYLKFNNYIYIDDLSYIKNNTKSVILLFKYNGVNVLRGYNDGILFPKISNFNIINIHINKKDKKIKAIMNYIVEIFKKYNIKDTKVYQSPYTSFILRHSLFSLASIDDEFEQKNILNLAFYFNDKINVLNKIEKYMGGGARTNINMFKKNPPLTNIYFSKVPNDIFERFKKKHFNLAGINTKSERCWEILKEFILSKKAILIESNNNYIFFLISKNICFYCINACSRKNKIVTYLLYKGIEWMLKNGCNFIYFGHHKNYFNDEKNKNIARFKKDFCNVIFTSYLLKL